MGRIKATPSVSRGRNNRLIYIYPTAPHPLVTVNIWLADLSQARTGRCPAHSTTSPTWPPPSSPIGISIFFVAPGDTYVWTICRGRQTPGWKPGGWVACTGWSGGAGREWEYHLQTLILALENRVFCLCLHVLEHVTTLKFASVRKLYLLFREIHSENLSKRLSRYNTCTIYAG